MYMYYICIVITLAHHPVVLMLPDTPVPTMPPPYKGLGETNNNIAVKTTEKKQLLLMSNPLAQ